MAARRAVRLSQWGELVAACLILPCALELFPATRVFEAVSRVPKRRGVNADPTELAQHVDALLLRLPWIWRRTCLRRAVVIATLLRRNGRAPEIVIGVRKGADAALQAHAWLRCDGVDPYLEHGNIMSYTPLERTTHVAS